MMNALSESTHSTLITSLVLSPSPSSFFVFIHSPFFVSLPPLPSSFFVFIPSLPLFAQVQQDYEASLEKALAAARAKAARDKDEAIVSAKAQYLDRKARLEMQVKETMEVERLSLLTEEQGGCE